MSNVESLARDWMTAKHDENEAKKARLNVEGQLIEALGAKQEGAETHTIGNYKVTLTGKLTRSMDADVWEKVKNNIPDDLWPVATKVSVDIKGMKWLQENDTATWKNISAAFATKPAKTAVAVKEV